MSSLALFKGMVFNFIFEFKLNNYSYYCFLVSVVSYYYASFSNFKFLNYLFGLVYWESSFLSESSLLFLSFFDELYEKLFVFEILSLIINV